MCGICGIVYFEKNHPVQKDLLIRMRDATIHRGPDAGGEFFGSQIALGFRRLAIIDLAGSNQPMFNEDKNLAIVFNGEIYNFQDLRPALIQKGHQFYSTGDTETIIHSYEEYGEDCVQHFNGMFAFAIWDAKKRNLFIARDRFGKKPLFYYMDSKRLLFASEMKAILADLSVPREIDYEALNDYLTYGYVPSPKTIFRHIYKLPAGHFLNCHEGQLATKQYWSVPFSPDSTLKEEELLEKLDHLLADAVRIRMISDVPLGAFLSGGVDSSTIVAYMAKQSSLPVKTFSINFEEEDFSEVKYARMVAKKYNTEHYEYTVKPDIVDLLPKLVYQYDEPFADSSCVPTYYVCKMARQQVTVTLSGDGGDEVFGGYTRYVHALRMNHHVKVIPKVIRQQVLKRLAQHIPLGTRNRNWTRLMSENGAMRYSHMMSWINPELKGFLLSDDMKSHLGLYSSEDKFEQLFNQYSQLDELSKFQAMDIATYLPEDILVKVDRASMLNSLESRSPLLDYRVMELMATVPVSLKYRHKTTKYLLKKVAEPLIPNEILTRPKMGFASPFIHWFRGPLSGMLQDILTSSVICQNGWFNKDFIRRLISDHQSGRTDFSFPIWTLLWLEIWLKTYCNDIDSKPQPSTNQIKMAV